MANFALRNLIASHLIQNVKNGVNTSAIRNQNQVRLQSGVVATKLVYTEYGEPCNVLKKCNDELSEVKPKEVLVKMLAAPVNPADINTIQGTYPSRPDLPAVGGNEGVGEIIQAGADVTNFAIGDRIVPLANNLGTWRTHVILPQDKIHKIPKDIGLVEASTLTVNPCTAYRMLKDFVTLQPGDVVIQNGANSACGQNIIQICKAWGLQSVNVVRDRPNLSELRSYLQNLGATHVLTEEEMRKTELFKSKTLPKPKLALNCVGGKSGLELIRHLDQGGTIVTYGGMAREPLVVAISALIFKDVCARGYWMTRWAKQNYSNPERFKMLDELIDLIRQGKLHGPAHKLVNFDDFKEALTNTMTMKGMVGKKYILNFGPL